MNLTPYQPYITAETMMGPNSVRVLESLFEKASPRFAPGDVILDLGCGTGLTSLVIARETGAKVYASDLWISAEDNAKRFRDWGVGERVAPFRDDANDLHFEPRAFDAVISVDSYHYFAGQAGFFQQKILPFVKDGGIVLIGVPGLKSEYAGRAEELLYDWATDESYMFKTVEQWREIIGSEGRIESVEVWEMNCFDDAWSEWLACDHEFARGDLQHFEAIIRPYTNFVGIHVKVKQ